MRRPFERKCVIRQAYLRFGNLGYKTTKRHADDSACRQYVMHWATIRCACSLCKTRSGKTTVAAAAHCKAWTSRGVHASWWIIINIVAFLLTYRGPFRGPSTSNGDYEIQGMLTLNSTPHHTSRNVPPPVDDGDKCSTGELQQ